MKKFISGILACLLMLVLTACAAGNGTSADNRAEKADVPKNDTILVVYFSATGNTQKVANTIAEQTGGTLFEIRPEQPYTTDDLNYCDKTSRVWSEHHDPNYRPAYVGDVENWDQYDTIYIGYPLWWQQAPHVVYSFVEQHNFNGKRVIPFCTSISSPLGTSAENLAKAAGTGDWQDGVRFNGSVSPSEVTTWVKGIQQHI